jgi:hypothetical protein
MTQSQQRRLALKLAGLRRVGHGEARIVVINGHVRLLRVMMSETLETKERNEQG